MNILETENFFANSSFFFLFFSMISYWVQISFDLQNWKSGQISMRIANFCLLSVLILRWKESGHFPLSNLYESLLFLSWSLSTFHFILENIELGTNPFFEFQKTFSYGASGTKNFQNNIQRTTSERKNPTKKSFVGAFTAPTALFINAFATFRLPVEMQHSSPLVPALQSNWLMMHVTVMILSYSALICGSLLSIAFLILTKNLDFDFSEPKKQIQFSKKSNSTEARILPQTNSLVAISETPEIVTQSSFLDFEYPTQNSLKQKFAENLDNLSYRILGIGFPLLTIGILSGAVWANEAWGSYWSWDPKETWALATWFVFAIYLHTRLTKGWRGKKPAIIASVGFITVWICFLGVNLLGEGLHSYGFLKDSL